MRILWFYLFVHTVAGQAGFGRSYLGNSRLCHTWDCLNKELNLTDSLPPREQYASIIRQLLPGTWHDVVDRALEICYENRSRKYTNTCPGQALLHCTVDQLIQSCPAESWVKADGCSPLSSISASANMFSQSRYINLEENLPLERRPEWFLKNYFNTKCCDVPQLFGDETLKKCGFTKFMFYHIHEAQRPDFGSNTRPRISLYTPFVKVGIYKPRPSPARLALPTKLEEKVENYEEVESDQDPLECCNMEEFIRPKWRAECGFDARWGPTRLSIVNSPIPTTTAAPAQKSKSNDVKITPLPCEKQNCIYRQLNIISESGEVRLDEFTRLLDNLTDRHPEWTKAKARVVTKCLSRPVIGYDGDCPINQILGCTADVLSENCPNLPKNDPCKHNTETKDGITCQVSASKYRPKNRHQFCSLPDLVSKDLLHQCNGSWTWDLEHAPPPPVQHYKKWVNNMNCKDLTNSSKCLITKMGIINEYGFIDYFKMKDSIRNFSQGEWSPYLNVYNTAFQGGPFYRQYCSSTKKLLNVIDSILLTCPVSRRSNSPQCTKIFNSLSRSPDNVTKEMHDSILKHFQLIYMPKQNQNLKKAYIKTNAMYDFGIFNNKDAPPVRLIDLEPKKKPLIILPVYQRMNIKNPINQVNNDGILRG